MADSACLMHGFSYASAIPNHSKQGNPMHVLGESISFGRFMSEPLSWERWSTFSHKKYVEEAASYAQPGSVAAKKAFFEAHYKKIAAQKAAAAASALLEQQNSAQSEAVDCTGGGGDDEKAVILHSEFDVFEKMEVAKIQDVNDCSIAVVSGGDGGSLDHNRLSVCFSENNDTVSCSEGSGTPQMERPLLKNSVGSEDVTSATSKKKSGLSSLKSSIQRKTWKIPSTPAKPVTPQLKKETIAILSTRKSGLDSVDKKRPSPKSLHGLIKLIPIKAPDKEPISAIKTDSTSASVCPSSSGAPKDCKTPLRTPIVAARKCGVKHPTSTPGSENRRMKTPADPSATGSKTAGPKWHILSSVYSKSVTACRNKLQSPSVSTPFMLRTEERAAKRKQKLEEKFNANEANKAQLQKTLKEKAGNELRKLSCGFCFKARPLPDFYKEREATINQIKKTQAARPQTVVLGRSSSSKKQGTASLPHPPPPPNPSIKNIVSKNPSRKNVAVTSKVFTSTLPERITHENKSPNIQH